MDTSQETKNIKANKIGNLYGKPSKRELQSGHIYENANSKALNNGDARVMKLIENLKEVDMEMAI